jgi:hypothetical protein
MVQQELQVIARRRYSDCGRFRSVPDVAGQFNSDRGRPESWPRYVSSAPRLLHIKLSQYVSCWGTMAGGEHGRRLRQGSLGGLPDRGEYVLV